MFSYKLQGESLRQRLSKLNQKDAIKFNFSRKKVYPARNLIYLVDLDDLLYTPRSNIHSSGSPGVHS